MGNVEVRFVPEDSIGLQPLCHGGNPALEIGPEFHRARTQQGEGTSIATSLLPFQIPGRTLAKCFTSEDTTHSPRIDIGFEALLVRAPDELGETALIEALVFFGEGEDDVGKTQACDVIQVTLKVLGIAHSKVAHAKLHRYTLHR